MKRKHGQEESAIKKVKTNTATPYLSDDSCWLITTFLDPTNVIRYCLPISKQWYRVVTDMTHLTARLILTNTSSREGRGEDYTANYEEFINVSYKSAFTKLGLMSVVPHTIVDFSDVCHFSRLECIHALRCGFTNGHLMPPTVTRINLVRTCPEDLENVLSGAHNIRCIKISESTLTHQAFCLLSAMKRLERIELTDAEMNTTDLSIIAQSESVTHLNISGTCIESAIISRLCLMKNLTHLGIENCHVDYYRDQLTISKNNNLLSLSLRGTKLLDIGCISKMSHLTSLDISRNPIADSSLHALVKLKNLTYLNVSHCGFGEHGSRAVCSMKSITHLDARKTSINDAIFGDLSRMTSLVHLSIDSLISDEAIRGIASRSGPKFPSLKSIRMPLLLDQDESPLREIVPIGANSIERVIMFPPNSGRYLPVHRQKKHPYIPKFDLS